MSKEIWGDLVLAAKRVDNCVNALAEAQYLFSAALDRAASRYGQSNIASLVGVSASFISDVRQGDRRPGHKLITGILLVKTPKEPSE